MFIGQKSIGFFSWGHALWSPRHREMAFGLIPRRNCPDGETIFRVQASLVWCWPAWRGWDFSRASRPQLRWWWGS